jgi:hypothetical protein
VEKQKVEDYSPVAFKEDCVALYALKNSHSLYFIPSKTACTFGGIAYEYVMVDSGCNTLLLPLPPVESLTVLAKTNTKVNAFAVTRVARSRRYTSAQPTKTTASAVRSVSILCARNSQSIVVRVLGRMSAGEIPSE